MPKQPLGKVVTIALIGCIVFVLIFYDIFALNYWGRDSTISVVLNEWSYEANPLLMFLLGVAFGGLIIHFFKWRP